MFTMPKVAQLFQGTKRKTPGCAENLAAPKIMLPQDNPVRRKARPRGLSPWLALLSILLLLPAPELGSQQQPKISVEVKVVTVLATVRDKHGEIVSNLGKDDFTLEEDGHAQPITYFTRDTDLALTLGLLVDTSESQRRVLDQERAASQSFLDDLLRDKDQAFVIHFDREVELLQDVTSSQEKIGKALQLLEASRPQFSQTNGNGGGGNGGGGNAGGGNGGGGNGGYGGGRQGRGGPGQGQRFGGAGTLLYDAVFLASDEVMKKQKGRKALVILSDGVDHGSKETLEEAIMTAQRADTVVYSILFADEQQNQSPFSFGGPGFGRRGGGGRRFPQEERPDGKKILERLSKETGGRLFEVSKKQPIGDIYRTIAEELRNQYSIGYTPAADIAPGYHKIHLATKQKEMTVQSRDGYYADR
jgi:VWFA-related protein